MNRKSNEALTSLPMNWILLAGFTGGLAEVIWVSLYAALSPLQGWDVAREITVSVFGSPVGDVFAPGLGLLIHFSLSIAIALAFASLLWSPLLQQFGRKGIIGGAIAALTAIWTFNFFVLLPVLNPAFVALMPLPVTLVSKLLFGVSLGVGMAVTPKLRRPASELIYRSAAPFVS